MSYPNRASYRNELVWTCPDQEIADMVEVACGDWEDTPYMAGQRCIGQGVDCVRFVCAVLDLLHGCRHEVPRHVQDFSLHDPEGARQVTDLFKSFYPGFTVLDRAERTVEPGDVIITGHRQGGPGHAILVGGQPNRLWQALKGGVRWGGMGLLRHYQTIFEIVRPCKENWTLES